MRYHVSVGERTFEVELSKDGVRVDGAPVDADLVGANGSSSMGLRVDDVVHRLLASRLGRGRWRLYVDGVGREADVVDERTRTIRELTGAGGEASGPKPVTAPMPGKVVKVEVKEGDRVVKGQGVVIVEAMKMENELSADGEGVVLRVHVQDGDAVEKDQLLVDLGPLDEDQT